jgi:sulfite reductase alpha subunit-like flavoprotein
LHKEVNEKFHLKAKILNVSDVKSVDIFNTNSLIIIIASTWGDGGPTDDCEDFNKMLESKEFWDGFKNGENLNIAIFGLGNSEYTYFNAQAKFFHKVLVEEHKLNEICTMGLGNSLYDIEKDFNEWKDKVFYKGLYSFFSKNYEKNYDFYKNNNLLNELPKESESKEVKKDFELFTSDKKEGSNIDNKNYSQNIQNHLNSKKVKILNIEELRPNNTNGSTLKVVFDLSGTNYKYKPAENILVYPKNNVETVNLILKQLTSDQENNVINYKILNNNKDSNLNLPLPEGITVKEALSEYIDLSCQITKSILSKLILFLTDSNDKNKINEILNDEKKMEAFLLKKYNISDFIKEYNSLKLSLKDLAEILPAITPRYYTCSSSNNKKNNSIELVITLVSWKGPKDDFRYGLTSNYFRDLYKSKSFSQKDEFANISLKESAFILPSDLSTPMLMMCTGSGIAPFISFLEELEFNKKDKKYETYLIFGSMNKKNDFIFEKELEEYKKNGILTDYYTAFSRDQEKKVYVQNVFEDQFKKERLEKLVNEKGLKIYICGSVSMGNAVIKKLGEIIGEENKEKMTKNNQLMSEMWENK